MGPKEVLEYAKKNDARQVDLRFTDLPGLNQHISYPISMLKEDAFEEGFGIDGSSIRGWAAINESDMLLIPDGSTAFMDPFTEVPTLVMTCDVIDPITRQHYDRDPRWIAKKAELFLQSSGVADTAYFGAEAEFFIFDNVSFDQNQHSGFYFIDAEEGRWNSGRRRTISATVLVTRKATSLFLQLTITRIFARKWSSDDQMRPRYRVPPS